MAADSRSSANGRTSVPADDGVAPPDDAYEGPVSLDQVLRDELEYLHHHRHPHRPRNALSRGLIGLALSGGGIRSATMNLGVLQALARMRLLPMADYLSTVSGGGYIGACLSSLLSWNGSHKPSRSGDADSCPFDFERGQSPVFSTQWESFPFRTAERAPEGRLGEALVAHLRTRGNFLIARTRLFSREALRGAGALLAGTLFNVAGFVLTLFVVAALYMATVLSVAPRAPQALGWRAAAAYQDTVNLERNRGALTNKQWIETMELAHASAAYTRAVSIGNADSVRLAARMRRAALDRLRNTSASLGRVDSAWVVNSRSRADSQSQMRTAHRTSITAPPPLAAGDSTIVRTVTRSAELCRLGLASCPATITTPLRIPTFGDALWRNLSLYNLALLHSPRPQPKYPRMNWFAKWWQSTVPNSSQALLGALLVGFAAGTLSMFWMTRSLRVYLEDGSTDEIRHQRGDSPEDGFERGVLRNMAWILACLAVGTLVAVRWLWSAASATDQLVMPLVPAALLLGAWLSTFVVGLGVLPRSQHWTRRLRSLASAFNAITGWGLVLLLAAGFAPAVIYALREHRAASGLGAIASLICTRLLVSRSAPVARRFSLPVRARRALLNLAVTFAIVAGLLFAAAVVAAEVQPISTWIIAVVLISAYILAGTLVNLNRFGAQYFYRDRLAETYLLSELPDAGGRLELYHDAMEVPLHELHGVCSSDPTWRNPAPYHLITAAINLAGSRDLTRKDRKSGYWLFSRLYCGSEHTGFRWTERYRNGETKLAHAMAVSGAAVSAGMGRLTSFAYAFAAVLFNIRLGVWMENPLYPQSVWPRPPVFWPLYLVREITMHTTETSRWVNISDGGHAGDNLGLYPLMQRRCKVIVVSDAECDPTLAFGSLTEALRQAYVDMGIDVDIDLSMIRPDATTGLSRSHCAIGRIHYPDRPDQASWLVYMKASLTGDEPSPMLNYKAESPAFPHEPTVDQFFDDAQFESYRALGVHVAEETFGEWARSDEFLPAQRQHMPQRDDTSVTESDDGLTVTLRFASSLTT